MTGQFHLSLVDAFSGVVRVHVDVLCPEVAPLESVDGTEVALLAVPQADRVQKLPGAVPVPDSDLNYIANLYRIYNQRAKWRKILSAQRY